MELGEGATPFARLLDLEKRANVLRAQIRTCRHDWTHSVPTPTTMMVKDYSRTDPREPPGYEPLRKAFGQRETRTCVVCGLDQFRETATPGEWPQWRCVTDI